MLDLPLFVASSSGTVALVKFGLAIVGGLIGLLFWCFSRSTQKAAWPAIAKRLGLAFDGERLHGERAGTTFDVSIDRRKVGDIHRTVTVLCVTDARLPRDLRLRTEGVAFAFLRNKDLQVGDRPFDEDVVIGGASAWRATLLSEAERALVAAAIGKGWRLEDGALHLEVMGVATRELEGLVDDANTLVDALIERDDDVTRLAARAETGDDPARELAFDRMDERFRDHPETLALARRLRDDASPAIALRAACVLVDLPRLAALAAGDGPTAVRVAAIAELAAYPNERVTRRAIAGLVAATPEPELLPALAAALGSVPVAGAEAALIDMLRTDRVAVLEAALDSLTHVGTVAAVRPLGAMRTLRSRARKVIVSIQERAGLPGAGSLSLAEDRAGALAVA